MRVAVLSDIHANVVALDAVLASIPSVDEVWHLGDVVGYGPHPDEVVARLRELGAIGVRGNHDAAALGGREIESFNVDARRAMEWTRATIADETRAWLAAQPETLEREGFLLVHGSPRDPIWEYVTSTPVARAAMAAMETRAGLHGHTHLPIAYIEDDGRLETMSPGSGSQLGFEGRRVLLNPGSVGQPRDGIPTSGWMLLDTDAGTATWRRTAYDISEVQAAMTAWACRSASWRAWRTGCRPMSGGRRPISGRKPGDRRVRVERHHSPYFRYTGPGQLTAKAAASAPTTTHGPLQRARQARAPRPAPGERGGDRRAPAQEEGPRDLQLGRDLVLRLRDRGDPARVHPGGRRRAGVQFSIEVSIAIAVLLGIVASATARSATRTPPAAARTRCRRRTSGGSPR